MLARETPRALAISVGVCPLARRARAAARVSGIGKFVSVTRQKDGTWIVSGFKDAPN